MLGNHQPECFAIPYEALAACEGKQTDLVSFARRDDVVVLKWSDTGIPQTLQFAVSEPVGMPRVPDKLTSIDPQFLSAMAEAVATTETDSPAVRNHAPLF